MDPTGGHQDPPRPVEDTMPEALTFDSGGVPCAAALYRPAPAGAAVPCVVMGHGFTGTQDQLAEHAAGLAEHGLAVLTFDYRRFGRSGGAPRQIVDAAEQLEDWRAAVRLARSLPGLDPARTALWGSSLSGGHVLRLASEDRRTRAVVAQVPEFGKGSESTADEIRAKKQQEHIPLGLLLRTTVRLLAAAVRDELRGRRGLPPRCIPVFALPGDVGAIIDPDSDRYLEHAVRTGPSWRNEFAPRLLLHPPVYLPGTAERVRAPLLVCVAEQDTETDPRRAARIARAAPRGEVVTYPVGHFAVYEDPVRSRVLEDQARFLVRRLRPGAEPAGGR